MGRVVLSTRVFHIPGKQTLDGVALCDDGIKRGQFGGQTLEELQAQYGPEVVEGDIDEAIKLIEEANITEPVVIESTVFYNYFGGLLKKWVNYESTESYQCEEHDTGMITSFHVRVDGRYFAFSDRTSLTHAEAIAKVRDSEAFNNQAA